MRSHFIQFYCSLYYLGIIDDYKTWWNLSFLKFHSFQSLCLRNNNTHKIVLVFFFSTIWAKYDNFGHLRRYYVFEVEAKFKFNYFGINISLLLCCFIIEKVIKYVEKFGFIDFSFLFLLSFLPWIKNQLTMSQITFDMFVVV